MSDYNKKNEDNVQQVKVIIHGNLSARSLGQFIVSLSEIYEIVQDYYESPYDIYLNRISKGSYILELLVDPEVWNTTVSIIHDTWKEAKWFWGFIGGNITWDIIKKVYTKNKSENRNGLSETTKIDLIDKVHRLGMDMIQNRCYVESELQGGKFVVIPELEHYQYLDNESDINIKVWQNKINIDKIIDTYFPSTNSVRNNSDYSNERGFSKEQYPIFLSLKQSFGDSKDIDELRKLVYLVTGVIQAEAVSEWTTKNDVKREMRKAVKKVLRDAECPSDELTELTQQLISLAEVHYRR